MANDNNLPSDEQKTGEVEINFDEPEAVGKKNVNNKTRSANPLERRLVEEEGVVNLFMGAGNEMHPKFDHPKNFPPYEKPENRPVELEADLTVAAAGNDALLVVTKQLPGTDGRVDLFSKKETREDILLQDTAPVAMLPEGKIILTKKEALDQAADYFKGLEQGPFEPIKSALETAEKGEIKTGKNFNNELSEMILDEKSRGPFVAAYLDEHSSGKGIGFKK